MTDKVQKIREGVERLKSQLLRGACSSQIAMETICKEEAYNEVLAILDIMQEEPKQCMYSKDNYTEEDRKVLCEGCEEKCKFNQVKESAILQHKEETCKENGNSLTQEPVSEELEKACEQLADNARKHKAETLSAFLSQTDYMQGVMDGVKWKVENLWKPADGDDLPEIDREVIALFDNGEVGFAHRPPEYWDGKNIITGKVTRYYPKTYDKGGWNIPNVKYWLDCLLPNMED